MENLPLLIYLPSIISLEDCAKFPIEKFDTVYYCKKGNVILKFIYWTSNWIVTIVLYCNFNSEDK